MSYRPEFRDRLLASLLERGRKKEIYGRLAAEAGVDRRTIENWCNALIGELVEAEVEQCKLAIEQPLLSPEGPTYAPGNTVDSIAYDNAARLARGEWLRGEYEKATLAGNEALRRARFDELQEIAPDIVTRILKVT